MKRQCLSKIAGLASIFLFSLGLSGAGALEGDRPLAQFPDSGNLRAALYPGSLAAPRTAVLGLAPKVYENEFGAFRLSVEKTKDAFYLILAAQGDRSFAVWSQGSWIIKRSLDDGRFLQAKVFLRSDPGCFLRIFPEGERCKMDVVLYGAVLNKDVILPGTFDDIVRAPLKTIVGWTRDLVDWGLYSPEPADYAELKEMAAAIRARLGGLRYVDDGGLDRDGKPVFIATGAPQPGKPGLNCSGFAQWVVDGLLGGMGLGFLDSGPLKEKHPELRKAGVDKAIDDKFDPFFGLDWTRNLGLAWAEASEPQRSHSLRENDVADSPFSLYSAAQDARNGGPPYDTFPAYDVDSGYLMKGLKAILYLRAMRDPGAAYLASLSHVDATGLRRHYHVALLLPWFDSKGSFRVDVFESAAETSLGAVMGRAPKDRVHLVRLAPRRDFAPPSLP